MTTAAVRVYAAPVVFLGRPAAAPTGREDRAPAASAAAGPGATSSPSPFLRDAAVALQGDRILAVGARAAVEREHGPAERLDAVLLPALVNAHTHLELSHLRGRVAGGVGLAPWIHRLIAIRGIDHVASRLGANGASDALEQAMLELDRFGVAAVGEVTNTLAALPFLARAGIVGTLFHEVFGFSERRIATALAEAEAMRSRTGPLPRGLSIAPSPHGVYSTHPRVVADLLEVGPASIHLAEDPAERLFCADAAGPFALLNRTLGATDLGRLGRSPVAVAAPHLGPRSLAVHAVDLDHEDVPELARSRATVVLCPRSNLHIGGRLADLPRLLAAEIPLAVGTDSLASSPSLSPLAELATLARAFPQVAPARLLRLAWNGEAVGAPGVGRLAAGTSPGIVAAPLDGDATRDPAAWLLDRFGAAERPFLWIARHRPEAAE